AGGAEEGKLQKARFGIGMTVVVFLIVGRSRVGLTPEAAPDAENEDWRKASASRERDGALGVASVEEKSEKPGMVVAMPAGGPEGRMGLRGRLVGSRASPIELRLPLSGSFTWEENRPVPICERSARLEDPETPLSSPRLKGVAALPTPDRLSNMPNPLVRSRLSNRLRFQSGLDEELGPAVAFNKLSPGSMLGAPKSESGVSLREDFRGSDGFGGSA
ncbi:MAG: hypothetical protein ACYDC1_02005, partial [Limisphaerales bacterium]